MVGTLTASSMLRLGPRRKEGRVSGTTQPQLAQLFQLSSTTWRPQCCPPEVSIEQRSTNKLHYPPLTVPPTATASLNSTCGHRRLLESESICCDESFSTPSQAQQHTNRLTPSFPRPLGASALQVHLPDTGKFIRILHWSQK